MKFIITYNLKMTTFPTPAELKQLHNAKILNTLETDRKFVLDKILNADNNSVVIYPLDLQLPINTIAEELRAKGYNISKGFCACHGIRGIIGPKCSNNLTTTITWS
jgi:hypothetical protein